jgi:hypothetical protein
MTAMTVVTTITETENEFWTRYFILVYVIVVMFIPSQES